MNTESMVGGWLMEKVVGGIKNDKFSASIAVFVLSIVFYAFVWASEKHDDLVSKGEYQALLELITDHTKEFRIVTAKQVIRDIQTDIRLAEATEAPDIELERLNNQLETAMLYRDCLIDEGSNCQHILNGL